MTARPNVAAPGVYVRVSVDYDDDEAFWDTTPLAEAMFLRGLAFSKKRGLDGFIPSAAVRRVGARWPHDPMHEIEELVRVGVWDAVEGGWQIRRFSIWQVDTEKQEQIRMAKRRAGLSRGHKNGSHDDESVDDCPLCQAASTCSADADQTLNGTPALASYIDIDRDPSAASAQHVLNASPIDQGQESEGGSAIRSEADFAAVADIPRARVVDEAGMLSSLAIARSFLHPQNTGGSAA